MKRKKLTRKFFERSAIIVARELLGKILVRKIGPGRSGKKIIRAIITETEAYNGPKDLASHASKGRTRRTEVMFGPAGHAYVYLIYGMYHCLNIVVERDGYPSGVLFRGAKVGDIELNGPGKLCRFLKIDKNFYGKDMTIGKDIWFEDDGEKIKPSQIKCSKRIGVDYAGPYKEKLWRFLYLPKK